MKIELSEKPQKPIIIEGFPGVGLVGTIATEFLIDHLKARQIGSIWSDKLPPLTAIHENKVVQPLGVFYSEKHNMMILHAISGVQGIEWEVADEILKIANELNAYEIISLESVGTMSQEISPEAETKSFFYADHEDARKRLKEAGAEPLKEGIIMGVTGALLLKAKIRHTCIFAETHSQLPDSKAAAKIIEILNHYQGLNIDVKPLIESAEKFEKKIKSIIEKGMMAQEQQEQKQKEKLSYLG
jgi:uncharacterized protein